MTLKYQKTKKECKKEIKEANNVCEGCGGELTPISAVDNVCRPTYWVGCKHCSCYRSGVKKMYFNIARTLVETRTILPYSHMKQPLAIDREHVEYYLDTQTAGLSPIIAQIHRMLLKEESGIK